VVDGGGVVDDDVDVAEFGQCVADRADDLAGAGHVAGEDEGLAVQCLDLAGELLQGIGAAGQDCHVGAGSRVGQGDFPAEAT